MKKKKRPLEHRYLKAESLLSTKTGGISLGSKFIWDLKFYLMEEYMQILHYWNYVKCLWNKVCYLASFKEVFQTRAQLLWNFRYSFVFMDMFLKRESRSKASIIFLKGLWPTKRLKTAVKVVENGVLVHEYNSVSLKENK